MRAHGLDGHGRLAVRIGHKLGGCAVYGNGRALAGTHHQIVAFIIGAGLQGQRKAGLIIRLHGGLIERRVGLGIRIGVGVDAGLQLIALGNRVGQAAGHCAVAIVAHIGGFYAPQLGDVQTVFLARSGGIAAHAVRRMRRLQSFVVGQHAIGVDIGHGHFAVHQRQTTRIADGDVYLRVCSGRGFLRQQRDAVQAHVSGDRRFKRIIIGNERLFFVAERFVGLQCGGDGVLRFERHFADRIDQRFDGLNGIGLSGGDLRGGRFHHIGERFVAVTDHQLGKCLRAAREAGLLQALAIQEGVRADLGERLGQRQLFQRLAAPERLIANARERIGQADVFQIYIIAVERGAAHGGDVLFHHHGADLLGVARPGLAVFRGVVRHFALAENGDFAVFTQRPGQIAAFAGDGINALRLGGCVHFQQLRQRADQHVVIAYQLLLRGGERVVGLRGRLDGGGGLGRDLADGGDHVDHGLRLLRVRFIAVRGLSLRGLFLRGLLLCRLFLRGLLLRGLLLHRRLLHGHRFNGIDQLGQLHVLGESAGGHAQQHGQRQQQCQQAFLHYNVPPSVSFGVISACAA